MASSSSRNRVTLASLSRIRSTVPGPSLRPAPERGSAGTGAGARREGSPAPPAARSSCALRRSLSAASSPTRCVISCSAACAVRRSLSAASARARSARTCPRASPWPASARRARSSVSARRTWRSWLSRSSLRVADRASFRALSVRSRAARRPRARSASASRKADRGAARTSTTDHPSGLSNATFTSPWLGHALHDSHDPKL